jgi:Ribosomal protein L11 methyltransferase (PrmA)
MARKYVKNWYLLIPVYAGLVSKTVAEFRDGNRILVSKSDYGEFREKLFQQHLRDRGFTYFTRRGRTLVETDNAIKMYMLPHYSNVLDEIYLNKVYGDKRLDGRPVIDVGASIGDSSLYFVKLGASEVHGFELDSERYAIAVENIQINDMTHLVIFTMMKPAVKT